MLSDQPLDAAGDDQGPTPTELFVGSLAACVGFYTRRFLARHHLETAGLRVEAAYTMSSDRPARVDHCTVHNSLRTPPGVHSALVKPADARPAPPATAGLWDAPAIWRSDHAAR